MKKLIEKDITSLRDEINNCRKEIFNVRLSALVGQMKDTSQFKKIRKQIARLKTAITIKESSVGH
jgi:large subunit ribosomal protein L29